MKQGTLVKTYKGKTINLLNIRSVFIRDYSGPLTSVVVTLVHHSDTKDKDLLEFQDYFGNEGDRGDSIQKSNKLRDSIVKDWEMALYEINTIKD